MQKLNPYCSRVKQKVYLHENDYRIDLLIGIA